MPKNPPNLPRRPASADPADRVTVQQTAFSYDVIGRFVCNDWGEVAASLADGGFPFDVVVIGTGMYGGYCAEKLYRLSVSLGLRILVLDAGVTLFATHYQNLPQQLGGAVSGPAHPHQGGRQQPSERGVGHAVDQQRPVPGLAYCLGGRSLFWGGWSPRLTAADLGNWPNDVITFLTQPVGNPPAAEYDRTEKEIGVVDRRLHVQQHFPRGPGPCIQERGSHPAAADQRGRGAVGGAGVCAGFRAVPVRQILLRTVPV